MAWMREVAVVERADRAPEKGVGWRVGKRCFNGVSKEIGIVLEHIRNAVPATDPFKHRVDCDFVHVDNHQPDCGAVR